MSPPQWPPAGTYHAPTWMAAQAAEVFDQHAARYDETYTYHEGDITEIVRLIGPRNKDRCLDLGCGTGMMAFALKQKVKKGLVVGVDCSAEILKAAAARGARIQVAGVQFRKGDITDQACVDMVAKHFAGNYDLITAVWVVSAIPVALQASTLKMWAEMLKPGGRLVVERGNSRGDEDTGEAWRIPGHSQPVQTVLPRYAVADQTSYDMCKRELEELAAAAGLTVVSTHRYFTHYLDHSAKTAEDAQEQWAKENGGPMPRYFMLSCRQEVIRNDMEMYQNQNFGFGLKNVSMIMILQKGGGGNAK